MGRELPWFDSRKRRPPVSDYIRIWSSRLREVRRYIMCTNFDLIHSKMATDFLFSYNKRME